MARDRKRDMIHCSFGRTTSSARIAAPYSQFRTMRIFSTMRAIGSAAEYGLDISIAFNDS